MAVVPFVTRAPASHDARPAGEPLPRLWELHAATILPALARSTVASYHQTRNLTGSLGDFPAIGDVALWVGWLRTQYLPPPGCRDSWTVHLHWHNLAALYRVAQTYGWASGANPAAAMKLRKPQARARAIVDVADLWPELLAAAHDARERALLTAARDTGARRGELLGLMPEDVVTLGEPWRLRFQRQRPRPNEWTTTPLKKNGANRSLPVTAELRAALAELLALGPPIIWQGQGRQAPLRSPFLFPYRVHELNDLRDRLRSVAPTAFPPGDFLHALRHTLSFELNRSGASDEEVQHQLGHSSPQSTREVYINLHARPVDVGPMARLEAARRAGVTGWGAPPGPPRKRTAAVRAAAVQECSVEQVTRRKENHPCSTPSRKSKVQRALPGLSVGPVVKRPRR